MDHKDDFSSKKNELHSCQNCDNSFEGIVCNACGQHPLEKDELDLPLLIKEWTGRRKQNGNILWKTIKMLLFSPGTILREYLNGKRHRYYNAVNFFLLIAAIATFVNITFVKLDEVAMAEYWKQAYADWGIEIKEDNKGGAIAMAWLMRHYNILLMITVPFLALASKWTYKKEGRTFGEHLIIHFFAYGIYVLAFTPFMPFINLGQTSNALVLTSTGIMFLWYFWVFKDFFQLKLSTAILRTLWFVILYWLVFVGFAILLLIAFALIVLVVLVIVKGFKLIF